jgi:hypothetical protein
MPNDHREVEFLAFGRRFPDQLVPNISTTNHMTDVVNCCKHELSHTREPSCKLIVQGDIRVKLDFWTVDILIHAAAPQWAVYRHAQDLDIFRAAAIMQFIQNSR